MKIAKKRPLLIVFGFLILILIFLVFGKNSLDLKPDEYHKWFETFRNSDFLPVIIVATYVIGAFIGVPQWALFLGTIIAIGPMMGSAFAWISTMISASLNFWLAKWIGAKRIRSFGGARVNQITALIRRNGFLMSFAVRLVPTGPFILVNMAAGISSVRFRSFLFGTALGIIPKIAVVALLAQGILSGVQQDWLMLAFMLGALLIIGLVIILRKRLKIMIRDE